MSTTSLPRRAARAGAVALAGIAATGTALLAAPSALAAPGDDGELTVHVETGSAQTRSTGTEACRFALRAADFDVVQNLAWTVEAQPPTRDVTTVSGTLSLTEGAGRTDRIVLPAGRYKLSWKVVGGLAPGKHKLIDVDCADRTAAAGPEAAAETPAGIGAGPEGGPVGAPAAGGGGLAQQEGGFSPVTGAVAMGLAGLGGAVLLRLRRRRSHGVA